MGDISNNQTKERGLGGHAILNSASIFISRVFGLIRDIFIGWYWGATGIAQAAFTTAFAIPNMLRMLFGEGAFTSVFVPMVTKRLAQKQDDEAWKLANRVISLQIVAMFLITVICAAISYTLFGVLTDVSPIWHQVFLILPIVMPYGLLICVTGSFGSILNSRHRFLSVQLVPILFSVVQIGTIGLLFWLAWTNEELKSLILFCVGAVLAGVVQMLVMMLLCRGVGYRFHFDFGWKDDAVKTMVLKMLPGLVGTGAVQLNTLIDKWLAASLGAEAVGALNFSQHLVYLPVGIFGVAVSTICLPFVSRARALNDEKEMLNSYNFCLRFVVFLALPCTAILAALGDDVVAGIFMRGAFDEQAVLNTYLALLFYLPGIPAYCWNKVAVTSYHSRLDTKTPVRIALFCMVMNLIMNLILMQYIGFRGLALSTSICAWIQVGLLFFFNRRNFADWSMGPALKAAFAIMFAAILAGATAWWVGAQVSNLHALLRIVVAGIPAGAVYLLAAVMLKRPEIKEIFTSFRHRK